MDKPFNLSSRTLNIKYAVLQWWKTNKTNKQKIEKKRRNISLSLSCKMSIETKTRKKENNSKNWYWWPNGTGKRVRVLMQRYKSDNSVFLRVKHLQTNQKTIQIMKLIFKKKDNI